MLIVLATLVSIVALVPDLGPVRALSMVTPFAQLIAFSAILGCGAGLFGLVFLLSACIIKRGRRYPFTIGLAWLIAGICFVLFPAGMTLPPPETSPVNAQTITVATFNSGSALTSTDIDTLVRSYAPNVIVLPETSGPELDDAVAGSGFHGSVYTVPDDGFPSTYTGDIDPTSVLVSTQLGPAQVIDGPMTSFGTVAIRFSDPSLPIVIGLHTAPPLPSIVHEWRSDLDRVIAFGEHSNTPLILAGDFNATLRHGPMATRTRLIDTAQQCGRFPQGTWPTAFPREFRSQIDHVMLSPNMVAHTCAVVDIGQSDHAAYIATIAMTL